MAQKTTKTFTEIYMGIRKDWGEINPVTRIIPNKKAYNRKRKHKNKDWEQATDESAPTDTLAD